MEKNKKTYSLNKQIMGIIMVIFTGLIGFLFYYTYYTIASFYRDIGISNAVGYKHYLDELEGTITELEEFMTDINVNNNDFNTLKSLGKDKDFYRYLAYYNLASLFSQKISSVDGLSGLILASSDADAFRYEFVNKFDYYEKNSLINFIEKQLIEEESYSSKNEKGGWHIAEAESSLYLVRMVGNNGTYLAVVLDFMSLTSDIYDEGTGSVEFIYTAKGKVLSNTVLAESLGFANTAKQADSADIHISQTLMKEESVNFYSGNYNVIGSPIDNTELFMYMLFPSNHWSELRFSQIFLVVITLAACLSISVIYYLLKNKMIRPLKYLVSTMEEIKDGNLEIVMEDFYQVEEFSKVYEAFNGMMKEIKELRIDAYEKEIEKQKARLQYLQLQIKPHFYLNCLKTLNAMVIGAKYDKMQVLIVNISNHLRYMFRDNSVLVTLDEELNYVIKYVELQKFASSVAFEFYMDIESTVMFYKVPPMTIQTFVENSIKYGANGEKVLEIQIKAIELQTEEMRFLDLIITDNGVGYPTDVLEYLNMDEQHIYEDKHVGITNLKNRFRLLYDLDVEYVFMNRDGAVSELIIPCTKQEI